MLRPLLSRERTLDPQSQSGRFGKEKKSLAHTAGFKHQTVQPLAECVMKLRICTHTHICNEESFKDSKEYEERARFGTSTVCMCVCVGGGSVCI